MKQPEMPDLNSMLAYLVHLFTALGAVLGFLAVIFILQGDAANALRVLALAVLVDAVDGTLARRVNVGRYAADIDGGLMDNLVDYLTWAFIPMLWAWTFLEIPFAVCAVVLLSSAFGFTHVRAKTPDHMFRGFPSYWNIVILYLYIIDTGTLISSLILLVLALLVVAPLTFVYPSRTPVLQRTTLLLSLPYIILIVVMLFYFDTTPLWLVLVSLYYPLYYVALSCYLSFNR